MTPNVTHRVTTLAISLAACGVLVAGWAGCLLLSTHTSEKVRKPGPMLLAPMIGVIDRCLIAKDTVTAQKMQDMQAACTGPNGSATALIESTLAELQPPGSTPGPYPLGYTLPVPLLQLFRQEAGGDWCGPCAIRPGP